MSGELLLHPRHIRLASNATDANPADPNLFRNFFCPAMKHLRTGVEGSRKKRIYDKPTYPSLFCSPVSF